MKTLTASVTVALALMTIGCSGNNAQINYGPSPDLAGPATMCAPEYAACTVAGTGSDKCCIGSLCTNGACEVCSSGRSCQTSDDCCIAYTCMRLINKCTPAADLNLGEPCRLDSQCVSKTCDGFCTKACTTNTACTNNTKCIEEVGGASDCFPTCDATHTCIVFGPGYLCREAQDVNGATTHVCAL